MLRSVLAVVIALLALLPAAEGSLAPVSFAAEDDVVITVDNSEDAPDAVCPGEGTCTLRAAIVLANADVTEFAVRIVFDTSVFPIEDAARIRLIDSPLPSVTRANVTIDASPAGAIVDGSALPDDVAQHGLILTGDNARLEGLALVHFTGSCVRLTGSNAIIGGDPDFFEANRLGDCAIGIEVRGPGAFVLGNRAGFSARGDARAGVGTGILVDAVDVTIGGEQAPARFGNVIGNAKVGIRVGGGLAAPFGGTVVAKNQVGRSPEGRNAPVSTGLLLSQFSGATSVMENAFDNTTFAGIAVAADVGGVSVARNTFWRNTFAPRSGLSIDLGADGMRNPNGGPSASGPNDGIDHPLILRATQARVSGMACGGCTVELYRASHVPGGAGDNGTVPVSIGFASADGNGAFSFEAPPITPGDWLAALATDQDGNTSEFGPSARVGAGIIQCGNVTLQPGWNLVGFFGTSAVALGATFPLDPQGRVEAIYARDNGQDTFRHWFRDAPVGATLDALQPGLAYWFLADEPLTLPQGFSLTSPLSVSLPEGWDEFVYFGATAPPLDALATIAGSWAEVFRYENPPGPGEGWVPLGGPASPAWLSGNGIEACGAYVIKMSAPALLTPLQP